MKKFVRTLCFILVLSVILVMPAYAESAVEPRGSMFFSSYGTALNKVSPTAFEIWFDVDANLAMMDVLGVSEIVIYRSADQQSWTAVGTFDMEDYPEMTDTDAYFYTNYVTFEYATPGYYYTADVTFYAKDYRGVGERYVYTEILLM